MLGKLGLREIAGGHGKYAGIDGLGTMDIGRSVTDDENFRWAQVGELALGVFEC